VISRNPGAIAIVGNSGAGKTTLLERLIPALKRKGVRVGVVKHDAHRFDIDHPGKDSHRLTAAGADTMMITSASMLAMVKRHAASPPIEELLERYFSDMDLVLVVRGKGGAWSNPVFITLMSGSIGWQIGAESTDFVIVFKTPRSIEGIMKGQYTLGAEAAAAAGPVGRSVKASTDIELKAEIYSYSRSRGLFAGVSLEGSSMQVDDKSNAAYYEKGEIHPSGILSGKDVKTPAGAEKLKKSLEKHAPAAAK